MPHAVVLVVDGLQSGFLGCYGNTWVDTPAFNRLAADGFCFDQVLADSVSLDLLYRGLWRGVHALAGERPAAAAVPLPKRLAAAGVRPMLVHDEPSGLPADRQWFDERIVPAVPPADRPAESVDATHTARFFAAAAEQAALVAGSGLLWLHTRGLNLPWDAPRELRESFREAEDPPPRETAADPAERLADDPDPDHILQAVQDYAAQVALLDHGLDWFLQALDASDWGRDALLVVCGGRGFALGEHGWIGPADFPSPAPAERLYGELLHLPLWIRLPGGEAEALRSSALVQPADLAATLAAWFALPAAGGLSPEHPAAGRDLLPLIRGEQDVLRSLAVAVCDDARLVRTEPWQLLLPQSDSGPARLFAKPDDRWEVLDVADRAAGVVEGLREALADFDRACQDPDAGALPALADELREPQE